MRAVHCTQPAMVVLCFLWKLRYSTRILSRFSEASSGGFFICWARDLCPDVNRILRRFLYLGGICVGGDVNRILRRFLYLGGISLCPDVNRIWRRFLYLGRGEKWGRAMSGRACGRAIVGMLVMWSNRIIAAAVQQGDYRSTVVALHVKKSRGRLDKQMAAVEKTKRPWGQRLQHRGCC